MTVLSENSTSRARWEIVTLNLVVVSCLLVSYQVAFQHRVSLVGSLIVYLIDLFFLADIALNFRTSYRSLGVDVTDLTLIKRRYGRVLFPIDLVAAVPFDALLLPWSGIEIGGVSIVLWVRLLRLVRVVRLFVIFGRWQRQSWVAASYLRIVRLLTFVGLLIHWIACAWFLIPYMEGFPQKSWVVLEGIQNADPITQYLRSVYWVVVTATTVGYGDITPNRNIEYLFAIFVILLGASIWAFFIGNIASLLSKLDAAKSAFWGQVDSVTQYLRSRRVPTEINEQVQSYYEYIWSRYRGANEHSLLTNLPAPLRLEVLFHLARELLERVPLFRNSGPVLRNELLLALKPLVVIPGGFIVREGEVANGIFFISRGTVEVVSGGGEVSHGTLEDGDYFGDLSLLLSERRKASVKALTYCDIFVLPKADFERIKRDYDEFREALKALSSERSEKISALVLSGAVL